LKHFTVSYFPSLQVPDLAEEETPTSCIRNEETRQRICQLMNFQ